MIKQIADLGIMSMLGSPMMLKLVPKAMVGTVVRKVSQHYLRSGHHLQEAMQDASEQALTAIDFGLQPKLFGKLFRSKSCKEFVQELQSNYFEPFFEAHPQLDREAFCKEGSKACRAILKRLDDLVDPLVPRDEDVHRFFSEGEVQLVGHRTSQGEALLFERLEEVEAVTPAFLTLLRYDRLLFQAIHYFFRLRIADDPSVKAMLDELKSLDVTKSIVEAQEQRGSIEKQLRGTRQQLKELSEVLTGDHSEIIQRQREQLMGEQEQLLEQLTSTRALLTEEATSIQEGFQSHIGGFEDRMGEQLWAARHELREAHNQVMEGLAQIDDHLDQQDEVLDEIKSMLKHLVKRGSSSGEYMSAATSMLRTSFGNKAPAQWKDGFQRAASQAGLSGNEVDRIVAQAVNPQTQSAQLLAEHEKAPHATFEVLAKDASEPRTFYVFFSERVTVGRHSRNDLVAYWYPLPDPPDPTNAEWRDWQGSGECHPSLNVSGLHFELNWRDGGLWICDRSSKGTWISGEQIPRGVEIAVGEGSVLSLSDVLTLSYSLLRNENDEPIGWRLRRLNNAPGREEYLFLASGAQISLGASSDDAIAFSASGVRPQHLSLRRDGTVLTLVPSEHNAQLNGEPIAENTSVRSGSRILVGQQIVWCFPPA